MKKISILVNLQGDEADLFESYKEEENIKANSTAAYKIICDSLKERQQNSIEQNQNQPSFTTLPRGV